MKRILLFLLVFAVIFPIKASAMSLQQRPAETLSGTPVSLPFPITNAPVGVTSASIRFLWGERDLSNLGAPYYRTEFSADYTIRYLGAQSGAIEIAVPIIGEYSPDPDIRVDGEPVELTAYMPISRIEEYTGPDNLAGYKTPVLAGYIDEIRAQAEPYVPRCFNADAPTKVYAIMQEDSEYKASSGLALTLSYDPERTTLLLSTPNSLEFEPKPDFTKDKNGNWINNSYEYGEIFFEFDQFDPFEVLVIGDDTLSWYLENWSGSADPIELSVVGEQTSIETPREFIMRTQEFERLFSDFFPIPLKLDDFLLRQTERLLDERSELPSNVPQSFSCVQDINNINHYHYATYQQSIVAAIHFKPGEERVLSVSYSPGTGMQWDKKKQQSLFHHTILTETAGYWDFFDEVSVTTSHPDDVIEAVFSEGFETAGDISVLTLQKPNDNINIGFRMNDEREEPDTNWELAFLLLGVIALRCWPITLGIIIVIVLVIRHNVRKNKAKKDTK